MQWDAPWIFFTDAVLRAPTVGSMLMCFAAALVGVVAFLRKQSLIGESLSHAAYPGVVLGVLIAGAWHVTSERMEGVLSVAILGGAFVTALLGILAIEVLYHKLNVRADAALCFVLSAFFGIGLTLASHVQVTHSSLYRQIQVYLYGQAATMTDVHIVIFGVLSLIVLLVFLLFYKEIQLISFDRLYAKSLGFPVRGLSLMVFLLIVLAVVIGIRSVGVVLMSAMFIAPAAAARQYTNKFHVMLFLAAAFGVFSGFLGNYLSVEGTRLLAHNYPGTRLALPTGPMIVLVATIICVFSMLFAPERGLIWRMVRMALFNYRCLSENILKTVWRFGPEQTISFNQIRRFQRVNSLYVYWLLWRLVRRGWMQKSRSGYTLTAEGAAWAASIVRLHRLWEVYLAEYLEVGAERVHRSAEEMEHIITPALERELTLLLNDPKLDPHRQPIPPLEGTLREGR